MEGQQWKHWRNIYNPGFSANHLMALVPDIIDETATFCQILQEHADAGDIFHMKDHTDNLAVDIMGKAVLDSRLTSQRSYNPMVEALRSQVRTLTYGANIKPFAAYDPMRLLLQLYNSYRMNSHLSRELDHRFKISQTGNKQLTKSIIDLALQTYTVDKPKDELDGMDATFKKFAISHVKLFLFSGHDTTSSSICYVFYLLSTHESALNAVRKEHDAVFGPVLEKRRAKLEQEPFLINQSPFILAVIKEALPLFPPLSSPRAGEPGFHLKDTDGHSFPTDGFLIWSISQAMHRDPEFWPQPDTFLPERWLAGPGDALAPAKGDWRPFEYGPRNCIGQELAIIEWKTVVVMALQTFDFEAAYKQLDWLAPIKGRSTVNGGRAHQVQLAQPSGDFPC